MLNPLRNNLVMSTMVPKWLTIMMRLLATFPENGLGHPRTGARDRGTDHDGLLSS